MSHQHRLGNWNENSNPIRDARARRNTIFINFTGNSSVGFNNHRERGSRTTTNELVSELNIDLPPRHDHGNSSTININHGGDPPTTITMNGDLGCTKRSRSTRGESSDEDGGISSRRRTISPQTQTQINSPITTHDPIEHDDPTTSSSVPPPQLPLTTSDPSPSNYSLNPPPGPQTDSGLPRSENVAIPGGNNSDFLTSQELMAERIWLRDQMSSSLQRLSNGGSMRRLDWMLLDYSILLNDLIDSQERLERIEQIYNSEDNSVADWMYELFEETQTPLGLTEQEILRCIHQEIYESRTEETSTMSQTCTICQEDYVEGERIGRVDCMHSFHLHCIKQWLEQKNVCPICKQTALEIDESESEDE